MKQPGNIPQRGNGTFFVSCGVLASLGVAQLVVGWSGWQGHGRSGQTQAPTPPVMLGPQPSTSSSRIQLPPSVAISPGALPPIATLPNAETEAPKLEGTASPPTAGVVPSATSLDVPLTDPAILGHLEGGLFLREKGDLVTAIGEFRAAWQLLPDHPRLIFQLAQTMDLMGLEHKSLPLWRSLADLGAAAGDYQNLVPERIMAADANPAPAGPLASLPDQMEKLITIEADDANHDKTVTSGERQVVHFKLAKHTRETIDVVKDLVLVVHFFEEVNGKRIARAELPELPVVNFLELPLEWEDGLPEPAEGIYYQPILSPQEILKFGQRVYYGYVLEVLWKGKLQDRQADPPELADFSRELPTGESLAPAADVNSASAAPPPPGVDSSLFPQPNQP